MDVINSNPNMLDYFRSSTNKEADKKASQLIMQKNRELSDVFLEIGCLRAHVKCRGERQLVIPGPAQEGNICTPDTTQEGVRGIVAGFQVIGQLKK